MPLPEDRDAFEAALRRAVAAVLPAARIDAVARTIIVVRLRVDLDDARFIDVFFNSRNHRADLCLIERDRRIFGHDNLGGRHCHPPEAVDQHIECAEPDIQDFIRRAVALRRTPWTP